MDHTIGTVLHDTLATDDELEDMYTLLRLTMIYDSDSTKWSVQQYQSIL
jgi:hypothetical protein